MRVEFPVGIPIFIEGHPTACATVHPTGCHGVVSYLVGYPVGCSMRLWDIPMAYPMHFNVVVSCPVRYPMVSWVTPAGYRMGP